MIDIHAHILPNLDDAPKEMDIILQMLSLAELDGITHIVATPHFAPGICTPTIAEIEAGLELVRAAAADVGFTVKLAGAAHEVRAGAGILDRWRRGELLAYCGNRRYLLLELPPTDLPRWVGELISALRADDVVPVLAHPERNSNVLENPAVLYDLIVKGCLAQVTAGSVLGQFGGKVRQLTELLLRHGLVHAVASDAHNDDDRPPVLSHSRLMVERIGGPGMAMALYETNPRRIMEGEECRVPEPKRPR